MVATGTSTGDIAASPKRSPVLSMADQIVDIANRKIAGSMIIHSSRVWASLAGPKLEVTSGRNVSRSGIMARVTTIRPAMLIRSISLRKRREWRSPPWPCASA